MKLILFMTVLEAVTSFSPRLQVRHAHTLMSAKNKEDGCVEYQDNNGFSRRNLVLSTIIGITSLTDRIQPVAAEGVKNVVVAGGTGQTGRRIVQRLATDESLNVVGGVRDIVKAQKSLSEASITVRGAMVQQVGKVDANGISLKRLDVVADSTEVLAATLKGADSLIIATGFVPGNPFKMNEAAHAVDNLGTIKLVDAAKAAGVGKVVMVSSILTNGRAWGQEKSPGFQVTNAFGNVLDEKIIAENYLRASGIDYTIVRPGGLKATPPTGVLQVSKEDTLNSGEISRDLVADVCVAALTDPKASNKVVEIIESSETNSALPTSKWFM